MLAARLSRAPGGERGLALVVVLWMLLVIAGLTAMFAGEARSDRQMAINTVELIRARAMLTAGLNRAALQLSDFRPELRWRTDGSIYAVPFDGGRILVSIRDERAKIDLNKAPEELIGGILGAITVAGEALGRPQIAALRDAILDWRDGDDSRRLAGAEDPEYRSAGLAHGAGDAPFESVAQLRQVLGVTNPIYEALAPHVTVFSARAKISPYTAAPEVLMALPGVSAADVATVLNLRERLREALEAEAQSGAGSSMSSGRSAAQQLAARIAERLSFAGAWIDTSEGPIYTVALSARTAAGVVATAEAVVWLAPRGDRGYRVLDWNDYGPSAMRLESEAEHMVRG